ncbi:MAG: AAA family ATPase [Candidatus Woesearchaeota archaeon]|nr:MAG: AAA family ATPase [Candidatus Woesearchaeota archaeon]
MSILVVFAGLPGTGKTTLCRLLKKKIDCEFFDSDEYAMKSKHFKMGSKELSEKELNKGRLEFYDKKLNEVRKLMSKNKIVIMDAVFDKEKLRNKFYKMIKEVGGELIIVKVTAPEKIIRERIQKDNSKRRPGFTKESRLRIYEIMKKGWEPIKKDHIVIDSSKDINEQLDELIKIIK